MSTTSSQAHLVTQTAALAHGESEFANTELTTSPFDGFSLPRLDQCDIAYGCELYEIKELVDVPQTLLFVEIKHLHINDWFFVFLGGVQVRTVLILSTA